MTFPHMMTLFLDRLRKQPCRPTAMLFCCLYGFSLIYKNPSCATNEKSARKTASACYAIGEELLQCYWKTQLSTPSLPILMTNSAASEKVD